MLKKILVFILIVEFAWALYGLFNKIPVSNQLVEKCSVTSVYCD